MAIKHQAFIDLEKGLTSRTAASWRQVWRSLCNELRPAIRSKDWTKANQIVDKLDTSSVVLSNAKYAQTVGMSALLLGASRLTPIHTSLVAKKPPARQLGNGVTQWGYIVGRNLPKLLTLDLHRKLHALEHEHEQGRHTFSKGEIRKESEMEEMRPAEEEDEKEATDEEVEELLDSVELDGTGLISLAASLMVSRLSSFGFLVEAQDQGIEEYEIDEVMDDHTCPVCEVMNGQVFKVVDGVAHATAIMDAEDPDSLRSIAPWPSQSADSVADLEDSDAEDLVDQGLALPPYHPGCRGIAVPVDNATPSEPASADDAESVAEDSMPSLSIGALSALLGLTQGIETARKYRGVPLETVQDEDEEQDDEADEDTDQDTDQARKKKTPSDI